MRLALVGGSREAVRLARLRPHALVVDPDALPPRLDADAVIDARHPFERAPLSELTILSGDVPVLRLRRAPWPRETRDRWQVVADASGAFRALSFSHKRIFLCLGEAEREPFVADGDRWYLVRARTGRALPPDSRVTEKAGPFTAAEEAALMIRHRIDVLVTRNAGGAGAYPKVRAARDLGLPVILIAMPDAEGPEVQSPAEAMAWIDSLSP